METLALERYRRARVDRRFTDNHIALLKTFADQAVIAIGMCGCSTRRQEALERQTATADI